MQLSEYQPKARSTAFDSALSPDYLFPGLAGEVGEVQEVLLNKYGTEDSEFGKQLVSELGDQLWFVALICEYFGLTFESIVLEEHFDSIEEFQNIVNDSIDKEEPTEEMLAYELALYVGDLCSVWAKAVRDTNRVLNAEKFRKLELGLSNVVFSVARLGSLWGYDIEYILDANIAKLFDRKERGVIGGSGNNR